MMLLLSIFALAIWVYLLVARGLFWLCRERDVTWHVDTASIRDWPDVRVVVPARDEAGVIEASLSALLAQDYRGRLGVTVVDDDSSDDTADRVRALGTRAGDRDVTLLHNNSLPAGWTGKLWAMKQGLDHAGRDTPPPAYVLFCDADIALARDTVSLMVAKAQAEHRVLVSLMARLSVSSPAEKALIPAFVFFFMKLYPFAWVSRAERATAAAAGGCMLVDRPALLRAGGLDEIRGAIIDDCSLGRLMKRHGPIALALTERATSLRGYDSFGAIRRMVARSAYAELRYSPLRLAGALAGLSLTYLVPPLALAFGAGAERIFGFCACLMMAGVFLPILRFYRLPLVLAPTLPLVAVVYGAFTFDSALQHWRGRGGAWKGRYQAALAGDRQP